MHVLMYVFFLWIKHLQISLYIKHIFYLNVIIYISLHIRYFKVFKTNYLNVIKVFL